MRFTATADLPPSELIRDRGEVLRACEYFSKAPLIGFDTETSGLDHDGLGVECHVVCLSDKKRRVAIVTGGADSDNFEPVAKMLEDTQDRHCCFNAIFDWNVIYGHSHFVRGRRPVQLTSCWADGGTLMNLFDEEGRDTYGQRGLKARAKHWIGLPMNDFSKVIENGKILEALDQSPMRATDYCTRDAWAHLGVCALGAEIARSMSWCHTCSECGKYCFNRDVRTGLVQCVNHDWVAPGEELSMWDWHCQLDVPFLSVLQKMQVRGMPVDWDYLKRAEDPLARAQQIALTKFLAAASAALSDAAGEPRIVDINPASPAQLGQFYYGTVNSDGERVGLGFPIVMRTKSGAPATGVEALKKLWAQHDAPGIKELLEYRDISKLLNTYVIGLQDKRFVETGRVHGRMRPSTKTSRLASADPNLQNLPARALLVQLPPALPYLPSYEELIHDFGLSEEEAQIELASPDYRGTDMKIHVRDAVRARPGEKLICADYSQLEIRLTALDSRCDELTRVINEGVDLHCYAASKAFAAGLREATYEDIYEAKQFDDGDFSVRLGTLRQMYTEGREGILSLKTVGQSYDLESISWALDELEPWVTQEEENSGLLPAIQNWAPEAWDAFCKTIGVRDKELLNFRRSAKAAIFGIIYGIGPTKLASQITEATKTPCSLDQSKELIQSIKDDIFPGIGRMVRRQHSLLRQRGYVRTAMGRYRHPAGAHSGDMALVARAQRQASNSPIQGLAANVVQRAMIAIESDLQLKELGFRLILQVHDELVSEGPEQNAQAALERMKYLMETAHGLVTPVYLAVSAHIGDTWAEAK